MEINQNKKNCPVCQNNHWQLFLETTGGQQMTSDQRVVRGNIHKVICSHCGAVTNKKKFSCQKLSSIYTQDYQLNLLDEHKFFTKDMIVARSESFFDWIKPYLPRNFSSLLEIGCGQGHVLKRFKDEYPDKRIYGIEGSKRACQLARAKGLSVKQQIVLKECDKLSDSDVIFSIGVLEHIQNVTLFLHILQCALNDRGRLILCLPIQNYLWYDIYFADHIWHLSINHCCYLFQAHGFRVIAWDNKSKINPGFGLFVLKKSDSLKNIRLPGESKYAIVNRDFWQKIFQNINKWLKKNRPKKIALFGSGEVATLLLTYTSLFRYEILALLDETPGKRNTKKHNIPIHSLDWLKTNKVDAVALTINPRYHRAVAKKLKKFQVKVYSFMKENDD